MKMILYYQICGSKERRWFFNTDCAVVKNEDDSLLPNVWKECFVDSDHFWVNWGCKWPTAQMNRIPF